MGSIQVRILSRILVKLKEEYTRELHSSKKQSLRCHRCGRLHFEKCRSRKNLCYECGKVGHFI